VTAEVLLSITFLARRDELWGRFSTCGGLSIRLPPLDTPAATSENRRPCLRLADVGQDGILRGGWQPPLSLYSAKLNKVGCA
jgi:hypothetical protein